MSATAICPEPLELRSGVTLGELLARAYEDVQAYGNAACPACDGPMHADGVDAHCIECGSRLA